MQADVEDAIEYAAELHGVPVALLRAIAIIESGGVPTAQTGSYSGLFQLSAAEFAKYGSGNIHDPWDNAMAAAGKIARERNQFELKYGRPAQAIDIYMIHQQGPAGYAAHLANPHGIAWQNISKYYYTEERAQQAIWGNLPAAAKAQFGSVHSVTSKGFVDWWRARLERAGAPAEPAKPIFVPKPKPAAPVRQKTWWDRLLEWLGW
jgi:hypothetical protein